MTWDKLTANQLVCALVVQDMQVVLPFYQTADVQRPCDLCYLTNNPLKAGRI